MPFSPLVSALLFAAALIACGEARAFCVESAVAGRAVKASVVPVRPQPARLFESSVAPSGQSCCNPRNLECNPDGAPEDGVVHFRATVDGGGRVMACGAPGPDPRQPPVLYAPLRGYLRFEANATFNPQRSTNVVNSPVVVRVLDADRRLVTSFPCL